MNFLTSLVTASLALVIGFAHLQPTIACLVVCSPVILQVAQDDAPCACSDHGDEAAPALVAAKEVCGCISSELVRTNQVPEIFAHSTQFELAPVLDEVAKIPFHVPLHFGERGPPDPGLVGLAGRGCRGVLALHCVWVI